MRCRLSATEMVARALRFTMHAGYPWLPEPRQQGLTAAAASEATQPAAESPSDTATGHVSISLPITSAGATGKSSEAAVYKATGSRGAEGQASASGTVLGSNGAAMSALGPNTPYTPPSAGRGSESGVSTSEPSSLSAADKLPSAPTSASATSEKHDGAVLPASDAQVTPLIVASMVETVCQLRIQWSVVMWFFGML